MKEIKKIHFTPRFPEQFHDFILQTLQTEFIVEETGNFPDYVFASEHIYRNNAIMDDLLSFRDAITVFFSGEAVFPDFNLFDYAICFDDELSFADRNLRLPTIEFFKTSVLHDFKTKTYQKKEAFCNFIYSNPDAHPYRDNFFHSLCKYKTVDSLGRHLKNVSNSFLPPPIATGHGVRKAFC